MERMTWQDAKDFISEQARPAIASVINKNGRPHSTPICIALDGDDIVFTTWFESVKGRVLREDPRITITLDDDKPPFAYVMIEGTAGISEDLVELRHWAGVIGGRYMGADLGDSYGERNGVPGELLVRVTVTRFVGFNDVAG